MKLPDRISRKLAGRGFGWPSAINYPASNEPAIHKSLPVHDYILTNVGLIGNHWKLIFHLDAPGPFLLEAHLTKHFFDCPYWVCASGLHRGNADVGKIVRRGFALAGIVALLDEATGYQEMRKRLALQETLRKYLSGAESRAKNFNLHHYPLTPTVMSPKRVKHAMSCHPERSEGSFSFRIGISEASLHFADEMKCRDPSRSLP